MRNINKLSHKTYIFLSIFSAFIAMILYRSTIFRCISFNTFVESKVKLWIIWGACLVVTYLLTFRRRKNYFSLFTNTVLPFGIYSAMAYDDQHYMIIGVVGFSILILCGLFCFALILANDIPDNFDETLKKFKCGIVHCLNGTKSIVSVCLSVLLIYISGLYAFDSPSIIPAVKPTAAVEENKAEAVEKNIPIISKIDESIWKNLTLEERLDTMQILANVEKVHLGISHEINVRTDSLGWGTYGTYDFNKHEITINTQVLMDDDSTEAVTTLCHELRHAFQHDVTDAYLSLDEEYQQLAVFDDVRKYYENLDDYQNASRDGFDEYENQTVEADSREYGEKRTAFYFQRVDKYFADLA